MLQELNQSLELIIYQTKANALLLGKIAIVLIGTQILCVLSGKRLLLLGLWPRKLYGTMGILFAPLLHANFNHLFFNMLAGLVLLDFLMLVEPLTWVWVVVYIWLLSGILVWLFGRTALHIGASAVITGIWSYLVYLMILGGGSILNVILGIICAYYFSGIFLGIFPGDKKTSWEGHFFGFLAGILVAYLNHN